MIDVVAVGRTDRPILRSGARPGDSLWVTGELGGAAAAVLAWQRGAAPAQVARQAFARPRPRIREALWLAERGLAHALIDLSDGLGGDAAHLAAASGVRIVIDAAAVPVHPAAVAAAGDPAAALRLGLAGGEDYELCFAAPAGGAEAAAAEFLAAFGLALRRVGSVEEGSGVWIRYADGRTEPLAVHGYQHFREDAV